MASLKTQAEDVFKHAPLPSSDHPVTRMLRLLPSPEPDAPIECQIFDYVLAPHTGGHVYEALSYVWGDAGATVDISLNGSPSPVTENLHAALLHLRNVCLERIIWVDAVCINQKDEEEKGRQIQYMASIYGYASSVVVWLGRSADGSDDALSSIRVAASGGLNEQAEWNDEAGTTFEEDADENILSLLQRRWFRRIWVLQEVALARRVIIACGHSTLEGHTFCQGIRYLNLSFEGQTELQSMVSSVTYLISGAIYREKYDGQPLGNVPLPELVDMYHDREAGVANDKVYGLLGMSTSIGVSSGSLVLRPDYTLSTEDLLRRLVTMALGKVVSVEPSKTRQAAAIKGRGMVVGRVKSVTAHETRLGRQDVSIEYRDELFESFHSRRSWMVRPPAKGIMTNDLICHMEGSPGLTLVRACDGFFLIVMITMTAGQDVVRTEKLNKPDANGVRLLPFDLLWDWEATANAAETRDEDSKRRWPPGANSDGLMARYNVAAAFHDAGIYQLARSQAEGLRRQGVMLGEDHPLMLSCLDLIALTYQGEGDWDKAFEVSVQAVSTRGTLQGTEHKDTLESLISFLSMRFHLDPIHWEEYMGQRMGYKIRNGRQLTERDVMRIMVDHDFRLRLLLHWTQGELPFTPTVIAHAHSLSYSLDAFFMLLDGLKEDRVVGEEQVATIVRCFDRSTVARFVDRFGHRLRITRAIIRALGDDGRRSAFLPVLLGVSASEPDGSHRPPFFLDESAVTELARSSCEDRVLRRAFRLLSGDAVVSQEAAVLIAASYSEEFVSLVLSRWGADAHIPEAVILAPLTDRVGRADILAMLLDRHWSRLEITKHVLERALETRHGGSAVLKALSMFPEDHMPVSLETIVFAMIAAGAMSLLEGFFADIGRDVVITDAMMRMAAGREEIGQRLVTLLVRQLGGPRTKTMVSRDVAVAAAANKSEGFSIISNYLEAWKMDILPDDDFLIAVAGNEETGHHILGKLFSYLGAANINVTEELMTAVVRNSVGGLEMTEMLLNVPNCSRYITADVLDAAAGNGKTGWAILDLLFRKGYAFSLTQEMLLQLVELADDVVMKRWSLKLGPGIRVTDDLLSALRRNERWKNEVFTVLADAETSCHTLDITDAGMWHFGSTFNVEAATYALSRLGTVGRYSFVTENYILTLTYLHKRRYQAPYGAEEEQALHLSLLRQVLPQGLEAQAVFSDTAMCMFLRGLRSRDLETLLESDITITRGMIEAAMGNTTDWSSLINILLDRFSDNTRIAHWVLMAAATKDKEVLASCLRQLDDRSLITSEAIACATRCIARSHDDDADKMRLVIDYSPEVAITDGMIVTAAAASSTGGVFKTLLGRRPAHTPLSESSMMDMLRNGISRQCLEMIHSHYGHEVPITYNVIAACPNGLRLHTVMELWGRHRSLTKDLVWALDFLEEPHIRFSLVTLLLDGVAQNMPVSQGMALEIVQSLHGGELKRYHDLPQSRFPTYITRRLVRALGEKLTSERNETLWILMNRCGGINSPKPELLPEIARYFDEEMMEVALDHWDYSHVTEAVMMGAVQNRNHGVPLVKLLIARSNPPVSELVTSDVIKASMSSNADNMDLFKLLIGVRQQHTAAVLPASVIMNLFRASVSFETMCYMMELQGQEFQLTDEILVLLVKSVDRYEMISLLEQQDSSILLTKAVVQAATTNIEHGQEIMRLLLTRLAANVRVTREGIVQILRSFDSRIVSLLLDGLDDSRMNEELLVEAIRMCDQEMVRRVVDRLARKVDMTCDMIEAAAASDHGGRILKWLLRQNAGLQLTGEAMIQAARLLDKATLLVLLSRRGVKVREESTANTHTREQDWVEEGMLIAAAQNKRHGKAGLRLLLDQLDENQVLVVDRVKENVVEAAAANDAAAEAILSFLFTRQGYRASVTERTIEAAAGNWNSRLLLEFLVEQCGIDNLPMTDKVAKAAATAYTTGTLAFICGRWKDMVMSDDVLEMLFGNRENSNSIYGTILARRKSRQALDGKVLVAASSSDWNISRLEFLLDHFWENISMTEASLRAIAASKPASFSLLLDRWVGSFPVSAQELAEIAAEFADEITFIRVLERFGDDIHVSEAIISAAARNPLTPILTRQGSPDIHYPISVLRCVCNRWVGKVLITDQVVTSAAANKGGHHALKFLVYRWGDDIKVSADAVVEAAQNPKGREVLEFMIDEWGTGLPISEDIIVAAAMNERGKDVMQCIAWHWGDRIRPTEAVIRAVAGNPAGEEILLELLWRWGTHVTDIPITESIMKAAIGNPKGRDILVLIFERWGTGNLSCTESMVEVSEGHPDGKAILQYVRGRLGESSFQE